MQLKNTKTLLEKISTLDIPISNTSRGELVQQTYRNNLTNEIKAALFEDCLESFPIDKDGIVPFRTKEGVILEIPNASIADKITNEFGSGALSIEVKFTIKGLEYNAAEMAEDYDLSVQAKEEKAIEQERKKQEKIKRDRANREARELKRARMVEAMFREGK